MAPGLVWKLDFGRGRNQTLCKFMDSFCVFFRQLVRREPWGSIKCFTDSA